MNYPPRGTDESKLNPLGGRQGRIQEFIIGGPIKKVSDDFLLQSGGGGRRAVRGGLENKICKTLFVAMTENLPRNHDLTNIFPINPHPNYLLLDPGIHYQNN